MLRCDCGHEIYEGDVHPEDGKEYECEECERKYTIRVHVQIWLEPDDTPAPKEA